MIGNLLYMAALNAPEIGEAMVDAFAHKLASALYDEAANRIGADTSTLAGMLSSSLSTLATSAQSGLETRVRAAVDNSLLSAGVTLVSTEELQLLREIAEASAGGRVAPDALASLKSILKKDGRAA